MAPGGELTTAGWRWLLLLSGYFLLGKVALQMAVAPGYATAIWPAAGLALGCVLAWGPRVAPAIGLGSVLVHLGTAPDLRSLGIVLAIGLGAACQAVAGAWLVRRAVPPGEELHGERQILALLGLGGPLACTLSATFGTSVLWLAGAVNLQDVPFHTFTWWVGDTIGVLVFAPLTLLVLSASARSRQAIVASATLGAFGLVTAIFLWVSAWEHERLQTSFERQAAPVGRALQRELDHHVDEVQDVARLLEVFPETDRASFRTYVAGELREQAGILALSWDPVVPGERRQQLEQEVRAQGFLEFEIREEDGTGKLRRAPARSEYVPVLYIEPHTPNQAMLGFDIASDPVRHRAMERALATGHPAATSAVTLPQTGKPGVLLLEAVPSPEGQLLGFAVGVLEIEQMMASVLRGQDLRGLSLQLTDLSAPAPLYTSGTASRRPLSWRASLEVGGRSWQLDVLSASPALGRSWVGWTVLALGLSVVSLLEVLMLVVTGRAERAQLAEAKYRDLFENAPDLYASLDPRDGRLLDCNQTACLALGHARTELIGRSVLELYAPEARPQAERALERFRQTGSVDDIELQLLRKDGSVLEASLSVSAVRGPDGAILSSRSVWRDIGLRKQVERDRQLMGELGELLQRLEDPARVHEVLADRLAAHFGASERAGPWPLPSLRERELLERIRERVEGRVQQLHQQLAVRRSEERLRAVLDQAPIVLFALDRDGVVQLSEGSALALMGLRPGELVGASALGVYAPEALALSHIRRALQGERFTSLDTLAGGVSFETRWEPITDAQGQLDGTVGVAFDVTDLEHARAAERRLTQELELRVEARTEELAQSERRFRTLFEDSPVPLWDEDFSEATALLDALGPDPTARKARLLAEPGLVQEIIRRVRIRQINAASLEMLGARSSAELLPNLKRLFGPGTLELLRDALLAYLDGKTTFQGECALLTLQGHKLEVSLRLSVVMGHERDWSQVVAAVVDLTDYRRALREKEVLLKEIHHRVKNNLQVVASLLNLQAHQVVGTQVHALFVQAQARIRSIVLVHDRLYHTEDLARVDFGTYVRELVERLVDAHGAEARGVSVQLELEDVRLPVSAAVPCGLVLNELVTNTLRHAFPAGRGGTLTVRLHKPSPDSARLTVIDDGVGLPTPAPSRGGPTLGLELVYTFAEQLGASLEIDGAHGTSVTLTFPLEPA
jgi:PAS domain S-box-containing protein